MKKQSRIRVKALAWIEDQGMLFTVRMSDSVKKDDYYRPVGGSVEFGEHAIDAVRREVMEELHTTVEAEEPPLILENLFTCNGEAGHEIVYLYPCRFKERRFYERRIFRLDEADGSQWDAQWISIKDCLSGVYRLVPQELVNWYREKDL